jgi:hypothetical protein
MPLREILIFLLTPDVLSRATMPTFGVLWITSGLITLWLFVRHTQPATQDDE